VFSLDGRVRDLKDIEHAHRDVIREVRQRGRHADEPHLARPLERQYRLEGVVLLQGLFGRRGVELDYIEVIRLHSGEALFDTRDDVVAREDVRVPLASRRRGRADHAAAFTRQVVLGAPARDVAPDALLAQSVVDRGIDVVDAGVEDGVEDGLGLGVADVAAPRDAAQFHGAVAEHGHIQSRPTQLPLR